MTDDDAVGAGDRAIVVLVDVDGVAGVHGGTLLAGGGDLFCVLPDAGKFIAVERADRLSDRQYGRRLSASGEDAGAGIACQEVVGSVQVEDSIAVGREIAEQAPSEIFTVDYIQVETDVDAFVADAAGVDQFAAEAGGGRYKFVEKQFCRL